MPPDPHADRPRLRRPAPGPRGPDPRLQLRSRVERARQARSRLHCVHRPRPRPAHRPADARGAARIPVPALRREHGAGRLVADERWLGGGGGDPGRTSRRLRRADEPRVGVLQPGDRRRAPLDRADDRPRQQAPAAHAARLLSGAHGTTHGPRRRPAGLRVAARVRHHGPRPALPTRLPVPCRRPRRLRQPPHPARARRVRVGRVAPPTGLLRRPRRRLLEAPRASSPPRPSTHQPDRQHESFVMSSVFITCAVTGAGDTVGKSDKVPVTPTQIAADCIAAAKAGAAVVHIHVRDPITGQGARNPDLYAEVVDIVRSSDVDVVLNLTAGMGGDLTFGSVEQPLPPAEIGTDLAGATERLEHVRRLMPEICTLDCGTMNFGEGDYIMTNSTSTLKEMARQIQALGVRPEIEAFDTGHLWQAKSLVNEGLIDEPVMIQLCMGVPWGAPPDLNTFMAMVNNVPESWTWSAFSLGRRQMEYVALAAIAGGNIRVGLEDNLYIGRGQTASNADLVTRAVEILDRLGFSLKSPEEVRAQLKLTKHG